MLESIADQLRNQKDRIITTWQARALKEIEAAPGVKSRLLRDGLPRLVDELIDVLTKKDRSTLMIDRKIAESLETAREHGVNRSELPYTLAELIREFHILREVVMEVLEEVEPLPIRERDIILKAFETYVNDSASRFAELQLKKHEEFTLTLVHDLRSPLFVIKLASWVIQSMAGDNPEYLREIQKINKNIARLDAMTRELLDVGRLRSGKGFNLHPVEMDLNVLIENTVRQLNEVYGERFVTVKGAEKIIGYWDLEGLRRMLENLAVNALKYGSPTAIIALSATQTPDSATFSVRNEGNPISPTDQIDIFEKFTRMESSESTAGWGLGLTVVKGIAKAHKGTVRLKSSPEHGTEFFVDLPKGLAAG